MPKSRRPTKSASRSTRDIALTSLAEVRSHQKSCDQKWKTQQRQRAEDLERVQQMHANNQALFLNGLGELRQALQVSQTERRSQFEGLQRSFDMLAEKVGSTEDAIAAERLARSDGDAAERREQFGWREKLYWVACATLVALLAFFASDDIKPRK